MDCKIERTFDPVIVNEIMRHPKIYPHISDDFCPTREDFDSTQAVRSEANYFLLVEDGAGVFFLHPHSRVLYEVHTCLKPECWGRVEIAKAGARWMFEHTNCEKIMTWVPVYNRIARRFALKAGMVEEGYLDLSYMRNGSLQGMHLLGLSKCQQPSQ